MLYHLMYVLRKLYKSLYNKTLDAIKSHKELCCTEQSEMGKSYFFL